MARPVKVKLIECPRDAMQGVNYFISTADKIKYLNLLLKAGFDTLDFGSFVSPKAIPQLADTAEVLNNLEIGSSHTKLLAIVANLRGVDEALKHPSISYLGYPFSISEIFQKRNTNSNIKTSLLTVEELLSKCDKAKKTAVIYLSMAFGNPYGEEWNEDLVVKWTSELVKRGAAIISLSDTVGVSTSASIATLFDQISTSFPDVEVGVHLHSRPENWREKIDAAYQNGCRRFDAAIRGFGGCPMASDSLTGNIATENLIDYLEENNEPLGLNMQSIEKAIRFSTKIFH